VKYRLTLFLFLFAINVHAAKKAKIVGEYVEVYSEADFDSEIIDEVYQNEVYQVSDKNVGPFYKIKLKSGKIGYVVDYQLNIEGRGIMKPQDLDDLEFLEQKKMLELNRKDGSIPDTEEESVFGKPIAGPVLQFTNFHEKTMGAEQVDDLVAIGYKSVAVFSWSTLVSFTAPKYYSKPAGNTAKGINLWADFGFSNSVAQMPTSDIRFAGTLFTRMSSIQLQTPTSNYDLQDITIGIAAEMAWTKKFRGFSTDVFLKYYFDKSNYAGLGFALLF
jgi:hypothetical protein